MHSRPFKLLNASERARIAELSGAALAGWRQAWAPPAAAAAAIACAPAAESGEVRQQADWLSFTAGAGTLYLAPARRALALVCGALAAGVEGAEPGADSLAMGLARAGLQDLAARLMSTPAVAGIGSPPPELWSRGSGAARICLPLPDGEIIAVLDSGLVAELLADLPSPLGRPVALTSPQQCIGGQPVEVRAWLGSADIDLATFQTLAVNDVLVLDSRIDRPLRITVAGRDATPRAVLGQAGQRKAIRLTTYSTDH